MKTRRSRWLLKDDNRLPPLLIPTDPKDENSVLIPNEAGMNAAKQEMLNGHAVSANYLVESFSPIGENPDLFINYENWAQYTYEMGGANHRICIVGWDDNYPAENFTHEVHVTDGDGNRSVDAERAARTTPPGNGAWLIKNSRGSETDAIADGMTAPDGTTYPENISNYGIVNEDGLHTGYNWISYYDQFLKMPETLEFTIEAEDGHTGILQYDFLITSFESYYEKQCGQPVSVSNIFTADQDMELTAVSARTVHDNSRVVFRIVKLNEDAKNPEDGEELSQFSEVFPYFGYHRTVLTNPLSLKKGDRFSVITTTSFLSGDGSRIWLYSAATDIGDPGRQTAAEPGESFVEENGRWQDWTEAEKDSEQTGEDPLSSESEKGPATVYDNFSIKVFFRER